MSAVLQEQPQSFIEVYASVALRTPRQAECFAYLVEYFRLNRTFPSYATIARNIGGSKTSAQFLVRRLVNLGAIVRIQSPDGRFVMAPAGVRVLNKKAVKLRK